MNREDHPQDKKWQTLLACSASTFAGEPSPPFGFVTSTLARIKAEKREQEVFERIGLRAILASLLALGVMVVLTVGLQVEDRVDVESGVNSIIQVQDISLS